MADSPSAVTTDDVFESFVFDPTPPRYPAHPDDNPGFRSPAVGKNRDEHRPEGA